MGLGDSRNQAQTNCRWREIDGLRERTLWAAVRVMGAGSWLRQMKYVWGGTLTDSQRGAAGGQSTADKASPPANVRGRAPGLLSPGRCYDAEQVERKSQRQDVPATGIWGRSNVGIY